MQVKHASIRPDEANPEELLPQPQRPIDEIPQTPENKARSSRHRHVPSLLDASDLSSLPDTESVIVQANTTTNVESPHAPFADPFFTSSLAEIAADKTPTTTPGSRKRTARAASLPDSVTDSERDYGGAKHKVKHVEEAPQSPVLVLKHSNKPSLIPRPVSSLANVKTEPAKVPLPTDSAPVSVADFERFEEPPAIHKENFRPGRIDEKDGSGLLFAASPTNLSNRLAELAESRRQQDMEQLSTIVSPGTPCHTADSPDTAISPIGSPSDEVFLIPRSSPPGPFAPTPGHPRLLVKDGAYHVQTPADAIPGSYNVSISFTLRLQKGRPQGWWDVVFPELPRLQQSECGYVYFWIPADQGIEVRTTHLKRYTLNQACLMGQFPLPLKLAIPLRLCDANFYGFLRDFKVTQTIRADVLEHDDLRTCRVQYHALCSIDLINRDFWSEKCGISLYIHGGPDGNFTCNVQAPQGSFQTVHLDSGPEAQPGISCLQIISAPISLVSLAITWEVIVPRAQLVGWTPRIKATPDPADMESALQEDYELAITEKRIEITNVEPLSRLEGRPSPSRRSQFKRFWFSRKWRRVFTVIVLILVFRLAYRIHEAWCGGQVVFLPGHMSEETVAVPAVQSVHAVQDPVIETPSAEPEFIEAHIEVQTITADPIKSEPVEMQHTDIGSIKPKPSTVEPIVASQLNATPSLSLRDRIDYFLGWRGPLAEI